MNIKSSLLIIALGLTAFASQAQTNTPTATPQTFFSSVEGYFTSFDTNLVFSGTYEASTGLEQATDGSGEASTIHFQRNIGSLHVGADGQFGGVGTAFNEFEASIGYRFINHFDTVADINLLAGYDGNAASGVVEPELAFSKKMTTHTYSRIAISKPFDFRDTKLDGNVRLKFELGFDY